MADAVSGSRKSYAMLFCNSLNISVIICIFKSRLKCIVIYIRHRKLGLYQLQGIGTIDCACHILARYGIAIYGQHRATER